MAIYEQSALGTVLSSMPGAISDAMASKQQQQMSQQQMMMNMQAMQQASMQLQQQKIAMGMDRGGYGNQDLSAYFSGLMMAPGELSTDDSGNFIWSMDASQALPTEQEAWSKYQQIVGPANITEADSRYFMNELWPSIIEKRSGQVVSELQKLEKAGYDESDMQTILYNNPHLKSDMSIVMPFIANMAPEVSAKFASYMPQKPVNMMERITEAGPYIGTVGAGGALGYQYMQGTAQPYIDEATTKFEGKLQRRGVDPTTRTTDKLTKAQKKLNEATRRNPRSPKGWNNRADAIDSARKTISKEKDKIKRVIEKARNIKASDVAKNTRWNRLMKNAPKTRLNMPIAAFAPTVLGGAGDIVAGPKGEAVGRGAGGGVQLAYGGAKGMSLAKWLMKKVPGIAARKGVQAGTMALADSPALPFGDIIGAAWGIGSGSYEIYNAIQEWRKANQSY